MSKMSLKPSKKMLKGSAAACAAMVALSGVVPSPLPIGDNQAMAMTTTSMSVTGTFVFGLAVTKGADVKFGSMLALKDTGTVNVNSAGAVAFGTTGQGVTIGGAPQNGSIGVKVVAQSKPVNVTVGGFGAVAVTGATPNVTGSVTLNTVTFHTAANILDTSEQFKAATPNQAITFGTQVNNTSFKSFPVGVKVGWSGTAPIGKFTHTVTVTMAF